MARLFSILSDNFLKIKLKFLISKLLVTNDLNSLNIKNLKFDKQEINLTELGYDKLLGTGTLNKKYIIQVKSFTKKAKEKIEKAGGQIKQI